MPALPAYSAGVKIRETGQYTIRGVPPQVDKALREKCRREHKSLNQVALEALKTVAGQAGQPIKYRDLSAFAGSWVEDPEFDKIIREMDTVHPDDWK